MGENEIGTVILDAAMRVHTALGPGVLESVYELCLAHELSKSGFLPEYRSSNWHFPSIHPPRTTASPASPAFGA
jgi:hypothetical protein